MVERCACVGAARCLFSFSFSFIFVCLEGIHGRIEKLRRRSDPVAHTRNVTSALHYRHNKILKKKIRQQKIKDLGYNISFVSKSTK